MGAPPQPGRSRSLRAQLLWWFASLFLLALLISTFVCYTIALEFATRAFDIRLEDTVQLLGQRVRPGSDGPVLDLPPAWQETMKSDLVVGDNFRVLTRSGRTIAGNAGVPAPADWPTTGSSVQYFDAVMGMAPVRVVALPVLAQQDGQQAMVLVSETIEDRTKLAKTLLATLLVPQLLLTLVALLLLSLIVKRAFTPLERVARAISQRGWDDLSSVSDEGAPGEVRPLTDAINGLLRKLTEARSTLQWFIADAAHQLRTPLAGLMAQTDRALRARDLDEARPALHQLQRSVQRATHLVNQMLTLARAESAVDPARGFNPLDLSKLVRQTCEHWVPDALAQDVDLGFVGDEGPVLIDGDAVLLQEMLTNLIDNAVRHARRPGNVTVGLKASPQIQVSVEDDGPGIAESELEHIFDRFYRVLGSPPGGCGLGLAIVREIAHAHRARVHVEPAGPTGGSIFRITFAATPRPAP